MMDMGPVVDAVSTNLHRHALDAHEIFCSFSKGITVEVKDGAMDVFVAAQNAGLSVRALRDQRLGFAFSTDMSSGPLSDMVDRVVQGISSCDPDPSLGFPSPPQTPEPQLDQFDNTLVRIPIEEKIDLARRLEQAARSFDPRVKKIRKAGCAETVGAVTICNSEGLHLSYKKTFFSATILVVAEEGGHAEMGWDYGFSPFFHQLDVDSIGTAAARRAVSGLGAKPVDSMQVPALLPPQVAADVLQVLSESFKADNVQKGKSMLISRVGEPVFSPHITIVDDGLYAGGMASSPFDDEGSFHKKSVLVSGGTVQGLLYDQYSANKENRLSTGNAGRHGIKTPPSVQPTNFFIENGTSDRNSLLRSLNRAIMVTDLMGLHTADPISGDFSVGATGHWIEKGEIVFPVKGIAISGNLKTLFRDVDGVANDLKFYGPFGSPTLRISNLHIAGSGS